MGANRRPDRVIDIFMSMDHYGRDRSFRHAMADGDRRRARIVAFTPIPSNWPEPHRAIWLARRNQLDIGVTTTRTAGPREIRLSNPPSRTRAPGHRP